LQYAYYELDTEDYIQADQEDLWESTIQTSDLNPMQLWASGSRSKDHLSQACVHRKLF